MVINGFANVVLSTLERRFGLLSTEAGVIAGSYDIGSMLSIIPITYFGGRLGTSKPKYIANGLVVMGLGSLMFALPHFITDEYLSHVSIAGNLSGSNSTSKPNLELCDVSKDLSDNANQDEMGVKAVESLVKYKYFFIFGQILHGIGAAPLITLGTTYLDENVSRVSAPLYIGIFQVH